MGHSPHGKRFAKRHALGYCAGMKYLAALLGLVIASISFSARAQSTPDDQYVSIYSQIQQGDALQAAGQTRQALDSYTHAADQLQKFSKVYPNWNPRIVNFRMNYLTQKINDLTAKLPAPAQTASPANGSATPPVSSAPKAGAPDISALQSQIKSLQDENASLQNKLKEALSAQPAESNPQELAMARAQIKSLLKENELLRTTGSQTSAPPVSAEVKQLQVTLADTKQKLLAQTERADKLAQENKTLQAKLQPLLANANALQALREENAMLKKQAASSQNAGRGDELAKLRAQVAALQSDADVNWLERAALENRLKQSQPGGANAAVENSSDFTATYHPSPETNGTEMATEKAVNSLPAGSEALVAEAENYFAAHQYDKAESDYEKILQQDPKNPVALANLAAIEMEENKLAAAEKHLQAALAQNPNDAYNLSLKGYLEFRRGKYDDALKALSAAAQLDPKNPQVQNYLGVTLSHKGRVNDAEAALLKAIELDPNYAAAHNNLAVIYINENPPKAALARAEYQRALDNGQPRNPDLEKLLAGKGAPIADGQ